MVFLCWERMLVRHVARIPHRCYRFPVSTYSGGLGTSRVPGASWQWRRSAAGSIRIMSECVRWTVASHSYSAHATHGEDESIKVSDCTMTQKHRGSQSLTFLKGLWVTSALLHRRHREQSGPLYSKASSISMMLYPLQSWGMMRHGWLFFSMHFTSPYVK